MLTRACSAILAAALVVRYKPWVAVGRLIATIIALAWASIPYWAVFAIGAVFGTAVLPSLQVRPRWCPLVASHADPTTLTYARKT